MIWYAKPERQRWRQDRDGTWSTAKDYDSVLSYTWDLSRDKEILVDGSTISTIVWTDTSGVTISSESNTTTTFTATITGTGSSVAHVTFADGQQKYIKFRWNPTDTRELDYE